MFGHLCSAPMSAAGDAPSSAAPSQFLGELGDLERQRLLDAGCAMLGDLAGLLPAEIAQIIGSEPSPALLGLLPERRTRQAKRRLNGGQPLVPMSGVRVMMVVGRRPRPLQLTF